MNKHLPGAAAALLMAAAGPAAAQVDATFPAPPVRDADAPADKPVFKADIHGVITTSVFAQDGSFGMGDGAITMWAAARQPDADRLQLGGDLRKTWLIGRATVLGLPGGWNATGRVEFDLLGAQGAGGFADENLAPRLRLAYVELQNGGTRVRLGQAWTPLVAHFPSSVSHFAMAYGSAGAIGFRYPGLFLHQRVTDERAPTQVRIDAAVFRNSWTGPDPVDNRDAGEIGSPQFEAGINVSNRTQPVKWEVNVVGHYDRKRVTDPQTGARSNLPGTAAQAGLRIEGGPVSLQGNAYWGRAIAQNWGQLLQFGDIASVGAWAQLGVQVSERLSAAVLYGFDDPDDADVLDAVQGPARLRNVNMHAMVRYDLRPVALSLEYFRAETTWQLPLAGASTVRAANQLALGAQFAF